MPSAKPRSLLPGRARSAWILALLAGCSGPRPAEDRETPATESIAPVSGPTGTSAATSPPAAAPAPPASSPPPAGPIEGVDISHYQGRIAWEVFTAANVGPDRRRFAVAKATEGNRSLDPTFADNFSALKAAGLIRGAYHFYEPGVDPAEQARHFIAHVALEPGDLPPVVDVETLGSTHETGPELAGELRTMLAALTAHYGVPPIIYTGAAFWNARVEGDFGVYPLWLARYGESPTLPKGWSRWTFWQYTPRGDVAGVPGHVDLDRYCCEELSLLALTLPPRR